MLEEAARMNGAAVRKAFEEVLAGWRKRWRRAAGIAWLNPGGFGRRLLGGCTIFAHVIHWHTLGITTRKAFYGVMRLTTPNEKI